MKKSILRHSALLISAICMLVLFTACGNRADDQGSGEMTEQSGQAEKEAGMDTKKAKLLYMGHASIRITTPEDKVIYIDPFAGEGYGPAADLILVTHAHYDHTVLDKIKNRASDCKTITWKEALEGGKHKSFDLGYARVEAVEAGYNKNHNVTECVGYVITLSDGIKVYVSGDTSKTKQMPELADEKIDYAFFCCDGVYNMDMEEAAECAALVKAKHSIPYHMVAADSGSYFDRSRAEQFKADGRIIISDGEEIELGE
jgi:L-ascorbate metabolism protein UlaG (beta-lactamase superfamily)